MAKFMVPQHIFAGKKALTEALPVLETFGKKVLLVTGPHVGKSSMMDLLVRKLGEAKISYFIFDNITCEPTVKMIEEGVRIYQDHACDFIIALGGGSPLDAAKAIAFMSVSDGVISNYLGKLLDAKIPPLVAIPTTAGTGSEVTRFTVITDEDKNIKMLLKGDCLMPDVAIVDPGLTIDMPKSITAATGVDALTHAIESFTSKNTTPLTDALAISSIKRIVEYLPIAYTSGLAKAREEMSVASLEAGICINNAGVTLVHGLSRPIGALFHVPHGLSNAMLLMHCMDFARDGANERLAELGIAVGAAAHSDDTDSAASKFLDKLDEILRLCEIMTLEQYGIDRDAFYSSIDKMADDALASGSPQNTRRAVSKEDCLDIYRDVFAAHR